MTVVFRDVSVADGTTPTRVHQDLIVEDGLIVDVRPTRGGYVSGDVVAEGGVLAPGLVDGHVHFRPVGREANCILALHYLAHGITNVMCMDGFPEVLGLRDEIAAGNALGPRIWTTGPIQNDPDLSFEAGRARALDQAAAGYDAIKVYNDLSLDGFRGLLAGARAVALPVVGHVVRSVGYEQTVRSDQSYIVHLEEFVYTRLGLEMPRLMDPRRIEIDLRVIDELCTDLITCGKTVGTTIEALVAAGHQVQDAASWCARPDIRQLPAAIRDPWLPPGNDYANRFTHPDHVRAFRRLVRLTGQLAVTLAARGVPLAAGSDALNCGVPPGTSLLQELRNLTRAGLSDAAAMRAVMSYPLSSAGVEGRRIEVGAEADLILLSGDPFESVAHLDGVRGVLRGDRWVDVRELRSEMRSATARLDSATFDPTDTAGCRTTP